jgi:hypothetical protein
MISNDTERDERERESFLALELEALNNIEGLRA